MHLWCQHTSRRTGRCAKGCRDSTIVPGTGLVGLVVLVLTLIDVSLYGLWLVVSGDEGGQYDGGGHCRRMRAARAH